MSRGLRVRESLILLEAQTKRVKEREVLPKKMASALLWWTWLYSHREGKHGVALRAIEDHARQHYSLKAPPGPVPLLHEWPLLQDPDGQHWPASSPGLMFQKGPKASILPQQKAGRHRRPGDTDTKGGIRKWRTKLH